MKINFSTEEEKLRTLDRFCNRLYRSLSLYYWKTRIYPMLKVHVQFQDELPAIFAVKDACVEAVLMSVRDIDDFFSRKKTWPNDLRSSDFGYPSSETFLAAERDSINQLIAHLTYQPICASKPNALPRLQQSWNTVELCGRAMRAAVGFLDYLICQWSHEHPDEAKKFQEIKNLLELTLKNMEAIAELESLAALS
jgi:hypothetical protein